MTGTARARALMNAAAAFFSTLIGRPPEPLACTERQARPALLSTGLRTAGVENRCPVCQARFRGARICSRCGANLEPLMRLSVKAWQLRQAARQAFGAGDWGGAFQFATAAEGIQSTGSGEALRLLAAWLKS